VSEPLPIEVSELAAGHIREAEAWWRANRLQAPNAVREELERAAALIALHPEPGTPARNTRLVGVRRVHLSRIRYDLYYRVPDAPKRVEILAFWHASRGAGAPI